MAGFVEPSDIKGEGLQELPLLVPWVGGIGVKEQVWE